MESIRPSQEEMRGQWSIPSSPHLLLSSPLGGLDMELRRIRALRGPNVWARVPVLEARVELGEWDRPSDQFPGFAERLLGSLPSLAEHRGGFVEELQRGTDLGTLLVQLTLELQTQAGTPVGF